MSKNIYYLSLLGENSNHQYIYSKPIYWRIGLSVFVIFNEISQCYLKKKSLSRLCT